MILARYLSQQRAEGAHNGGCGMISSNPGAKRILSWNFKEYMRTDRGHLPIYQVAQEGAQSRHGTLGGSDHMLYHLGDNFSL